MSQNELTTTLSRVTVFQDRAQLYRHAVVHLVPGEQIVVVGGIWSKADRDTLQVGILGKQSRSATLRSVQFTTVTKVEDVRPQRAALDAELKEAQWELREVQDALAVQDTAAKAYEAVRRRVAATTGDTFHSSHRDPSAIQAVLKYTSDGLTKANAAKRSLEPKQVQIQEKISNIKQRLASLGGGDVRKTMSDVAEIIIHSAAEVEVELQLSYVVRGPSWTPAYDIRVDSASKAVEVSCNATVTQSTNESWNNIALELSTAQQSGASPPACQRWVLDFYAPVQYNRIQRGPLMASRGMSNMMMQQMMTNEMEVCDEEDGVRAPAARLGTAAAKVTQSSTSATYEVAGRTTIKCDGQPVRVGIVQAVLKGYFRYSAVPKLSPHSYLKVKTTNNTEFSFLPGKTNIFADNQYVSNSEMNLVAPGEEFWTFIGIDANVTVARVETKKKTATEGGYFSGKTNVLAFRYKFTAKNMKKTPEEVVIWDQLPITEDKKLKVTLTSPATKMGDPDTGKPGADPKYLIDKDSFIEWIVILKPGEERSFYFEFSVENPNDATVVGL